MEPATLMIQSPDGVSSQLQVDNNDNHPSIYTQQTTHRAIRNRNRRRLGSGEGDTFIASIRRKDVTTIKSLQVKHILIFL